MPPFPRCSRCNRPKPDDEFKQCERCRAKAAERLEEWRKKRGADNTICTSCRGEKPDDRWKQCPRCRENTRAAMAAMRAKDPEKFAAVQRAWHRGRRELVIAHYGGKCACCGETTFEFLALDHTNGGGTVHRAEVGRGNGMVGWIIRNHFPEGFRVMCHNCNQAIGFWGFCPHQRSGEE